MMLYFSWVDEDEIFNPNHHAQHQEEIFSFNLTEREGEFPLATLEIKNPYEGFQQLSAKEWCFISIKMQGKIQLLFKGRLCPIPHSLKRETLKLNFIAQSSLWREKLHEFHLSLKSTSSWDPLFVRAEDEENPQESLEARSELFYWCRTTGRLSLSNIFWGSQRVDLKENHFYDSLNFRMGEPPLQSVQVSLSAQWVQKYLGQTNITPFITSCFHEGMVNTLTGKDLEAKWWSTQDKIGQSGYWISRSSLKEIKPAGTGQLNLYPTRSSLIWISPEDPAYGDHKPDQPQQKSLKRSWYKINLWVGWFFRRKRVETVNFVLEQNLQISTHGQNRRHLKLHLENIMQSPEIPSWQSHWNYGVGFQVLYKNNLYTNLRRHKSKETFEETQHHWQADHQNRAFQIQGCQGQFFPTDRGRKAIEHAIEIARAHLAISARSIDISVAGPLEHFVSLTCDHSVQIHDHRLPGQSVWGKVKALKLCLDGQTGKQWGELTLGVSVGDSATPPTRVNISTAQSSYSLEYADHDYNKDNLSGTTESAISYNLLIPSVNDDKWLCPDALTGHDIVEKVVIKNRASAQNDYLLQHQYPTDHSIEKTLKKVPTQIYIQLADLQSWHTQPRNFSVEIDYPWSAPHQINL